MACGAAATGTRPRSFPEQKGMSILLDVFYRADANVDGVLTMGEFRSFFCDRNTSDQHSKEIFKELASQDAAVHASEFCAFVIQHVGPFREVLAALEDLSTAVYHSAEVTSEEYPNAAFRTKFVTRLLLRETLLQLATVQGAVEAVCMRIEEHEAPRTTRTDSVCSDLIVSSRPPPPSVQNHSTNTYTKADDDHRHGMISPSVSSAALPTLADNLITDDKVKQLESFLDKLDKFESFQSRLSNVDDINVQLTKLNNIIDKLDSLNEKLGKLEKVVDKLEDKVELEGLHEEVIDITEENLLLIIQEKLEVEENRLYEFKRSLDTYVEDTRLSDGCVHVSVLSYQDSPTSVIYEIWESEEKWSKHVRSAIYKTFQHHNIEHLKKPEFFNTIQLPASWWKRTSR